LKNPFSKITGLQINFLKEITTMAEELKLDPVAKGEYFDVLTIKLADPDGPINLTGAEVRMVARKRYKSPVIFDFKPVITDPIGGEIKTTGFIMDHQVDEYLFDLFVDMNGVPKKYFYGTLIVSNSVSI
jgi:hypothetical protein